MPDQGLSRILAHHVATTSYEHFDTAAIRAGKTSLLDLFGVMLAATGLEPCVRPFLELAREGGGTPVCTIVGQTQRSSVTTAAFTNGALSHAIDFDDGHDYAPVHPTAVCVPPLMAIAESLNSTGLDFLEALVVGSDITCRMGLALTVGIDQFGWYPPPILGAFGAVAACGRLLRLNEDQLVDAFSLVLSQATASAEILYSPRSHLRSVRDAFATHAAVTSALLAQKGIIGFDAPIEGRAGFVNNYARGHFDSAVLLAGLGQCFENRNLGYKLWPSCRGTHGYVQVALDLISRHGIVAADVQRIELEGHGFGEKLMLPVEQKLRPQTSVGAKFSLPFTMGTVFAHGRVTMEDFFDDRLSDPQVLSLADITTFKPIEPAPRSMTSAVVTVHRRDGSVVTGRTEHALGHPANPIPAADLVAKFHMCADYAEAPLSGNVQSRIVDMVEHLEELDAAADLIELLGG